MTDDFTHTTDEGDVQMVDIGEKSDAARRAVATGTIELSQATVDAIKGDDIGKGDVLTTARIGAIQAVKHTWEAIPMCHQIPITNVDVIHQVDDDQIEMEVAVETRGKTGCEMEALHGVATGLCVIWDMVKAAEKTATGEYPTTRIREIQVTQKEKTPLD